MLLAEVGKGQAVDLGELEVVEAGEGVERVALVVVLGDDGLGGVVELVGGLVGGLEVDAVRALGGVELDEPGVLGAVHVHVNV